MAAKDQYIVGGSLQMPPAAGPPAIASPTIAPTSTTGSGKDEPLTAEDAIALFTQLLSNPQIMQQLMGMMGGAGGKGLPGMPPGGERTIETPYSNELWGGTPGGGHIQWMGGMPPGYNDDVARKLATSANVGNLWTQGGGQLASGLVSGLLGGGRAGQAAGGLTNLLPMLLPFLMK